MISLRNCWASSPYGTPLYQEQHSVHDGRIRIHCCKGDSNEMVVEVSLMSGPPRMACILRPCMSHELTGPWLLLF